MAGRSQPLPLPPPTASRRGGATPLRDLSHGGTTSPGPPVLVPRDPTVARAGLATAAPLLAQRLRPPLPAGTAAVPLPLAGLPASGPTPAAVAGAAEVPRQPQRAAAPP